MSDNLNFGNFSELQEVGVPYILTILDDELNKDSGYVELIEEEKEEEEEVDKDEKQEDDEEDHQNEGKDVEVIPDPFPSQQKRNRKNESTIHEFYELSGEFFVCRLCKLDKKRDPFKVKNLGRNTGGSRWVHIKTKHRNHIGELNLSLKAEIDYRARGGMSIPENFSEYPLQKYFSRVSLGLALEMDKMRADGKSRLANINDEILSQYSEMIHHIVTGLLPLSFSFYCHV